MKKLNNTEPELEKALLIKKTCIFVNFAIMFDLNVVIHLA